MPLVRFELKNEYGLGDPRLYQGALKEEEDPRNILGGVAISGLVGILRQLGDLAELAAVVFRDVHQQVMTTAARGHKVLNRIQKIEATLPQFEKAVEEQKSHIHLAYIAGCDWHANIQTRHCQFFPGDLPEFMLDFYEECRDPPRLHLLDKFDSAGTGACLKRYSDPFYYRALMASSDSVMAKKSNNGMKLQRKKTQRSRRGNGLARHFINRALPGRSLNSGMQFASLVTNNLNFLVDDASVSDTLSISGFTTELKHFSADKRSGCLKLQNPPSSSSKELHDGMPSTDAKTTQKVERIINNGNKVTAGDYVIQDSLHQQNDSYSSSVSCAEKTEMIISVSQMQSHVIPEDGSNPKSTGLSNSLSSRNHLIDKLGTQGEHISRSLTWDVNAIDSLGARVKAVSSLSSFVSKENATGNPKILDRSVCRTYSAASDQKAEIIESASSNFPEGIFSYRPPDSNFLFATLETSNQKSEMDDTEMHNQETVLHDTINMTMPCSAGSQISVLTSQLDNYMDVTNDLDYRTGQEVILLPHLNYNGMECEIKSLKVTIPSLDGIYNEIAHEPCASLKKKISLQDILDPLQSSGSAESASRLLYAAENAVSENPTYDITVENNSQMINSAPWLDVVIPTTLAVVIDKIPPEDSSSQDSFCDTYAKIVTEKENLCEDRLNQEMELTAESNCQGTESQSSMEKVITASKSDWPNSEVHVACFSSSPCPEVIIHNTEDLVIDRVPSEDLMSQCYLGGTSAKHASENEVICERQTKQETEPTDESSCQGSKYQSNMVNVIAVIPPESLSQYSFGDTSAKTPEKLVLSELQTNQEAESMTKNCQGTEYQIIIEKVIAASNFDGPNSESHVASCGSSDAIASPILCDLIISDSLNNISSSTLGSDVTLSETPISIVSLRNDFEDRRGNICSQSTNKSVIIPSDVTASTPVVSQGFPDDSFRKFSINIWTNGGILGLEPSKPPDISFPNAYGSDDICDDRSAANSQPRVLGSGNELKKLFFDADKLSLISFPEQDNTMSKISDEQSDSMLSKHRPKCSIQASSFCQIGKDKNAYLSGTASEIDGVQGKIGGTISSEAYIYSKNLPESPASRLNIGVSVGFSSLAHRFLVSNLQRKFSINGITPLSELMNNDVHKLRCTKIHSKDKERPKLAISSAPIHKLGNKEDFSLGFSGLSEKLESSSLDSSGYQSPPLENMKVSFQQKNDSDVSKLNLEFFSSQQQGNVTFPSFQLRTESSQPLLDGILESDDDTFCRSSPYSSDDLLSLPSGSDTEIWGDDEIDISYRIEATGSISKSIEFNACNVSEVNDVANLKHRSDELSFNSDDTIDFSNVSLEIPQCQLHSCNPSMQQNLLLSRLPNEL